MRLTFARFRGPKTEARAPSGACASAKRLVSELGPRDRPTEQEPFPMVVDKPTPAADAAASVSGRAAEQEVVVGCPSHLAGEREWNLWELERIIRERTGVHTVLEEECSFRLMCLRQFASVDGTLPAEFDALVREWFADLLDPLPA